MSRTITTTTATDVVTAAMEIADDVVQGRLSPTALEDQAVAELREMVGEVVGPDDPVWSLQCDIARQVLALDGVPADELAEWLAVARTRAGDPVGTVTPADTPPESVPLASVAHGPETVPPDDAPAADDVPDTAPVALAVVPPPTSPRPDHYDPLAAWAAGGARRGV